MSLKILDFTTKNGLVLCNNIIDAQNNAELLYLNEAKKLGASAVFFRRFYKENVAKPYHSEPAVCIFKKENVFFKSEEHLKLHAAIWSSTKNEVYIIHSKTRIEIINARKPAEVIGKNELSLENLVMASSDFIDEYNNNQFSAHLFTSGTFWEQSEFEDQLDEKNSPYIYLLDYLMTVRKSFLNSNKINLKPETLDKLLVICILIKFLEEIKDDEGKHTLRIIYSIYNINSFSDALTKDNNLCVTILNDLSDEFNGQIFNKFSFEEKEAIQGTDLSLLADFLLANINLTSRQLFLWNQYSFKHLPAEVISAIYENFIQAESLRLTGETEKGVVYTPIHLVNFLIDEAMPLNKPDLFLNERFTILDPACGSGVFLVAAFKRLLQWWAINNSSIGEICYPQREKAKEILQNNIFGIDVKETATLVSIFGLTTALLDKLTPKEIWNNFKFHDLSQQNIINSDFFKWASKAKLANIQFDLIVGNPPFNIETGKNKEEILNPEFITLIDFKHKKIPNNNFALHFFEGSMSLAKNVCLIIPSNVILYNNSSPALKYRKQVFSDFTIKTIFDFTHLRRGLFHKTADTPVVAIVGENKPSNQEAIEHIVIKRLNSTEKKIRFEIDHYDVHLVKWDWAIDEKKQFVWKTNLLGGGRLFHLIYRLKLLPTLNDFIASKNTWKEIRGFEGGEGITLENQDRIVGIKKNGEPEIAKNVSIKTSFLKDDYMYEPPFMIIDQVLGECNIPTCFIPKKNEYTSKKILFYNRDFIGISVPEEDENFLKDIYNSFYNKKDENYLNFKLFVLANSSSSMILTETDVNKSEILDIPYPTKKEFLKLSYTEKILQNDILNYYVHLAKAISENGAGRILQEKVVKDQLLSFGEVFCNILNVTYAKSDKKWHLGSVYQTAMFTICQFGFGKNNGMEYSYTNDENEVSPSFIQDKISNSGAIYTKVIRIYKHIEGYDCVYLIKPNSKRYWLNSIALHDADDTFIDLKRAGF
ncbi:MAG: N-6 DNA methylase [Bacteroidia bacterium]|nr:N-6 DNA methylase [Bacteroidia bacterium]